MVNEINKVDLSTSFASKPLKKIEMPSLPSLFMDSKISNKKKNSMEEALSKVSDSSLRAKIKEAYENGNPSRAFVEYLIKKHEKHQEKFEAAWAEYQAAKDNLQFYKKICEIMTKRYENSESNFEQGLISKSEKNYKAADLSADILLSKASSIAHSIFS